METARQWSGRSCGGLSLSPSLSMRAEGSVSFEGGKGFSSDLCALLLAIDDSPARRYNSISSRLLSASERAGSSVKDFVDVGNIADQMKSTPFWLVDLIEEAK